MKYLKSVLVVILFISFTSCNKVLEELANDETVLLTKKIWTYDSISGYNDFGNLVAGALFTGTTYQFRADGTYTAVILGQTGNSTWEFNSDKTVIILEPGSSDAVEWSIVTLNDTELQISFTEVDALAGIVTLTFK